MANWNSWRAAVMAAALVAWPVFATAQDQQSGSSSQSSSSSQQTTGQQNQSTDQNQQNANQGQSGSQNQGQMGTQNQSSSGQGFGQGQGQADNVRQEALGQLTAARQSLAEMTKLPAAAHLEGQGRNEVNQLITDFNALITSTGPEWRQAYDKVQSDLRTAIGPDPNAPGESTVGTSGTAPTNIDPSLAAKLNEMRQHVDQFGQIVGVKPGQSAVAAESQGGTMQNTQSSSSATGTSGTANPSATVNNQQALQNIDQINAILSRVLAQPSMSPNQDTVTVSKQDLQQIQQYLNQLRQSVSGGSGR